jgi:hypothetical protein
MKTVLVSAALLGAVSASSAAATTDSMRPVAPPDAMTSGEGGNGAGSVKLASAVTSAFLFVPNTVQSPLVTVGEGGEGGEGGKGRRLGRQREGAEERRLRQLNAEERRLRQLNAEERRLRQLNAEERRLRQLEAEEQRLRRLEAEERRLRRQRADAEERLLRRQRADRGLDDPRLFRPRPVFD